ncbi:MAG: hypothetical protein JO072_02780 [Parafilimonas sp.]|nr:hypothetical protein [Parafilimonas sp.]
MLTEIPYSWQLLINIGCNILASGIFIFLLLWLGKPKFNISCFICAMPETNPEFNKGKDNVIKYTMKIVNKSIFHAFDTDFELRLMSPTFHTAAHSNLMIISLPARAAKMKHIPRYRKNYKDKDPFALFANLIHTTEDLRSFLNVPENYLELKVTVRHGLTGLADTFIQTFSNPDCIKPNHKFGFGKRLDVIPFNEGV